MAATESLVITRPGRVTQWRRKVREYRLPWLPILVFALMIVAAVFAPWLAPHETDTLNILNKNIPPGATAEHLLGTDTLGRDILSRMIFGARTTVLISLAALLTGGVVGTVLGLVSGYIGGWTDTIIMRITDAALGFPTILVALVIAVILGKGTEVIILAVALTVWARFARMIRGDVLAIKVLDFVTVAKISGVSTPVLIWRHIFPNVVNTLMVITSLLVGQVILLEAALSFLGLGLAPGAPSWGIMVSEGKDVILDVWWLSLFPGVAITIVVLAFNFFGDWIRDQLDPKLRHSM